MDFGRGVAFSGIRFLPYGQAMSVDGEHHGQQAALLQGLDELHDADDDDKPDGVTDGTEEPVKQR